MNKKLVIVESPAKAKTVNRYLGSDYSVRASFGHIRDLPEKSIGVDVENDFEPEYKIIPARKKIVSQLQKEAAKSHSVILAADPDREGEAICWHLSEVLKKYNKEIHRVLFHEITKKAVEDAFKRILPLDEDKINAQQARRILDRLVGYRISPLLWKKIGKGLSAGRVQSIALRLICEREKKINDFVPKEFWDIKAQLKASSPPVFAAGLVKIRGKKANVKDEETAKKILSDLEKILFVLEDLKVKLKKKNPYPPYITSTLQQDSYRINKFSVKKTMMIAQKLYEGVEIGGRGLGGLITYMRTDSVRISEEALRKGRAYIEKRFSKDYLSNTPRRFKNTRKAQDAHEAIRPTSFDLPPEKVEPNLSKDELRVYSMIWNRFIASQMSPARIEETVFEIKAGDYHFRAKGEVMKFKGFLAVYPDMKNKDERLPPAEKGELLKLEKLDSEQKFTQPPPRYSEGTLVKELESRGIGRPSTYAPIISTIQGRGYVLKRKGRFIPTEVGIFVNDYLIDNFPDLMQFEFTAQLEEALDLISEGEKSWVEYIKSYNELLDEDLKKASQKEGVKSKGIPSEEKCPECGRPLVIKSGKYGKFKACSGFPECRYKKSLNTKEAKPLDEKCPECGSQLVLRQGRYGSFIACSNYPRCKYIKKENKDTGIGCPECSGTIVMKKTKKGKVFYGCSNFPKCRFASWDEPVSRPCPKCGRVLVFRKNLIKGKSYLYCGNKDCDYKEFIDREKIWGKKRNKEVGAD
ncbi:MAG: type I DNA topoisomerase [Candidatus Aminicenantes bacterium]|nr:type I DNA topoisomerase [Candidatus Aminicenantes bacterium]